jgi:hypothetical protein
MEQQTFNPEGFKEVKPKVKILIGKDASEVDSKITMFEKTHRVVDIKQQCETVAIMFYVDDEEEKHE